MSKRAAAARPAGPKRAGIYVRVSNERQAEKVSPATQEDDGRAYCEARGYQVADVYRDVEKYRAGGRLVEPSGTRSDRPQLRRMLADADAGKFDVLVAWREDRLYRGVNLSMLEISDRVKKGLIDVELVKEHYDPSVATVKAWAAGVELQAKHDRVIMGMAGRLASGKATNLNPPYGYQLIDGAFVVDPYEAEWTRRIFQWYADGVRLADIRAQLIAAGARQKRGGRQPWALSVLQRMLRRESYTAGSYPITWGGETYPIVMPPLIARDVFERCQARRDTWKAYPAGNSKGGSLAAGYVYCQACGVRLSVDVVGKPTGKVYHYYRCNNVSRYQSSPGCVRSMPRAKVDDEVWAKVWQTLSVPGRLEALVDARLEEVRAESADADAAQARLRNSIEQLDSDEQWVITQARRRAITEDQMDRQLGALAFERLGLERDLREKELMGDGRADKLLEAIRLYREQAAAGLAGLNEPPINEEDARRQFALRRKWVEMIVTRVDVTPGKTIHVHAEIDLHANLAGLGIATPSAYWRLYDSKPLRVYLTL